MIQLNFKVRATLLPLLMLLGTTIYAQLPNVILGRPTDSAITVSVMFSQASECYVEYGTQSGLYVYSSSQKSLAAKIPEEIDLNGLVPNTKYYYRIESRPTGSGTFQPSAEYHFTTQRQPGTSFTFTLEADEHLYDKKGVDNMYRVTLENQAADHPDFMLSLGDIFGDDHNPLTTTFHDMDSLHYSYRPFLGAVCHSIPFYICLGNHEGENNYYYSITPPNNICVYGTLSRKQYFPNPYPNHFYSGDTVSEPYGIGQPENYFSWEWGDALFVVLDVYRYECDTSPKPQKWDWTLGAAQYNWLKHTLENSTSKYKFVFAHHIRGQGRGGITNATQFEWGGIDGGQNKFAQYRPNFAKPIHQLFLDNGVNIFFQGHDHVFAHEILDGITYQSLPMAADSTYEIGMLANADAYTSDTLDGTGHLRVTVNPNCVTVDYVRAYLPKDTLSGIHHNGEVAFSYTLGACGASSVEEPETPTAKVFPNPANTQLHIVIPKTIRNTNFHLMNSIGETLLKSDQAELHIDQVPDGFYILQITGENFNENQKIWIRH
ncbi:MAG: metallophosphoesterase [Chitinophagales bacterium]